MNKVNAEQFNEEKQSFLKKHNFDYTINTSEMINNSYRKKPLIK